FRIDKPIVSSGQFLGTVRLFATNRFVEQRLQRDFNADATCLALLDLILIVGLYVVLWLTVIRPLRSVQRFATEVSTGKRPQESTSGDVRAVGELGELKESLERMVQLLQERFADLRASEQRFR